MAICPKDQIKFQTVLGPCIICPKCQTLYEWDSEHLSWNSSEILSLIPQGFPYVETSSQYSVLKQVTLTPVLQAELSLVLEMRLCSLFGLDYNTEMNERILRIKTTLDLVKIWFPESWVYGNYSHKLTELVKMGNLTCPHGEEVGKTCGKCIMNQVRKVPHASTGGC